MARTGAKRSARPRSGGALQSWLRSLGRSLRRGAARSRLRGRTALVWLALAAFALLAAALVLLLPPPPPGLPQVQRSVRDAHDAGPEADLRPEQDAADHAGPPQRRSPDGSELRLSREGRPHSRLGGTHHRGGANGPTEDGGLTLADLEERCARGARNTGNNTFPLKAHAYASLRVHAAAAVAAETCTSSRWPLRRALRPFLASTLVGPRAAQLAGGYLVTDLPGAWSDALIVHVRRADACGALAQAASWNARFAAAPTEARARAADAARGLCFDEYAAVDGRLRLSDPGPAFVDAVAFERPCRRPASDADADDREGEPSAVLQALLDGVLPDGVPLPRPAAGKLPCGVPLLPQALADALAANAAAIHRAPPTAVLHTPTQLAQAVRHPVPVDNLLPLLLPNAAELAAAAAAGDPAALIAALTPPVLQPALPGMITSFNVLISPLGVQTALRPLPYRSGAGPRPPPAAAAPPCPADLVDLFEPEPPPPPSFDRAAAVSAFEEAAVGGAAARDHLRRIAPAAMLLPYWPPEGGAELSEMRAPGEPSDGAPSATLDVFNVATPARDDQPVWHAACDAWDVGASKGADGRPPPVVRVSEVVVLPHASDLYYWVTVDLIGRLQLLAPYLDANPHVRVHLSYAFARTWANDSTHFAWQWLDALGLIDRIVTGRVVARIAHVLDRTPVGPRVHPLQLLAARDAANRVLARAGYPSLAQLHRSRSESNVQPRDVGAGASTLRPAADPPSTVDRAADGAPASAGGVSTAPPSPDAGSLLLLQRRAGGPRHVPNLKELSEYLTARWLAPMVWDPPEASATSLATSIATWARADAVVAPHGSGLANALFMKPGATVIESVPRGHAGTGLYYLQLAHVARLRHHHIVMPGTLVTPVEHDLELVEALLCGDAVNYTVAGPLASEGGRFHPVAAAAAFANGRCGPASASRLLDRDRRNAPTRNRDGQRLECLPSPRPARIRLAAHEPIHALKPVDAISVTVPCAYRSRFAVGDGTAEVHHPWSSLPDVLPLSEVRAVAAIIPGGDKDGTFISADPTQRRLIRALEAAQILPLALPGLLCCNGTGVCYLNYDESCGGPHASLIVGVVGAMVKAVAAERGIAPADVPVVAVGLSSGGDFSGVLGSSLRVAAIVAQLEPPISRLIAVHNIASGAPEPPCRITDPRPIAIAPDLLGVHDPVAANTGDMPVRIPMADLAGVLRPPSAVEPPAIWLTGAPMHPGDYSAIMRFASSWHEATRHPAPPPNAPEPRPASLVINTWAPTAVSAAEFHRAAPWLLSYGAAALVTDGGLATGLLEAPAPEQLAALASFRPWCAQDGVFSDDLFGPLTGEPGAAPPAAPMAAGEPALYMPFRQNNIVALDSSLRLLTDGVAFRLTGPAPGEPAFFAAHELLFSASGTRNLTGFARFVRPDRCAPLEPPGHDRASLECYAAYERYAFVYGWLRRTINGSKGTHEYHDSPWEDMVAWMSRAVPDPDR